MPAATDWDIESTQEIAPNPTSNVTIPPVVPGQSDRLQLAYQNNNPGNLEYAGQPGATQNGRWAKFDDPDTGYDAVKAQIAKDAGRGLTLEQYISKYAPAKDGNDTEQYIQDAAKSLGVDRTTKLGTLDYQKLAAFQVARESGAKVAPSDWDVVSEEPVNWDIDQQAPIDVNGIATFPSQPTGVPGMERLGGVPPGGAGSPPAPPGLGYPPKAPVPGMERLGGASPAAGVAPPAPGALATTTAQIQAQHGIPLEHIAPPVNPTVPTFAPTRPLAPGPETLDPQEYDKLVQESWKGYGGEIPQGDTPSEKLAFAVARAAAGVISPESLVFTIGAMGLGGLVSGALKSEQFAQALKDSPGVLKALNVFADHAVSATVGTYNSLRGLKTGWEAYNAHKNGDDDTAISKGVEAVADAVFAGLAGWGLYKGQEAVRAQYPTAEEATATLRPAEAELAEQTGTGTPPTRQQQATAAARAQQLSAQGENLAARAWQNIAEWGNLPQSSAIPINGERYILNRVTYNVPRTDATGNVVGQAKQFGYQLLDPQGNVVVAGPPEVVQGRIRQMTGAPTTRGEAGGALSVGSGAAEVAGLPERPGALNPPAIQAGAPTGITSSFSGVSPKQFPAQESAAPPVKAGMPEVGNSFEINGNKYQVTVVQGGRVTYDQTLPDGSVQKGKSRPLPVFQNMIQSSQPSVAAAPGTKPPQPSNVAAEPGKPPTVASPAPLLPSQTTGTPTSAKTPSAAETPVQQQEPQTSEGPEKAGEKEVVDVNGGNQGLQQPGTAAANTGNPPPSPITPERPAPLSGLPGQGRGGPGGGALEPAAGNPSENSGRPGGAQPPEPALVRRVTGSADIPLSDAGVQQIKQLAAAQPKPFDYVISGSDQRFVDTASAFSDNVAREPALNGWARGADEGKPAADVNEDHTQLILNPDRRAPGVSPISGKPGQTRNEFEKPLISEVRNTLDNLAPDERALMVTSGGGLQFIDAWGAAGSPGTLAQSDREEMAKRPYWSQTGQLFLFDPKSGLTKVKDNSKPGLYFIEHGATQFNPPKVQAQPQQAKPAVSPAEPPSSLPEQTTGAPGSAKAPSAPATPVQEQELQPSYSSTQVNLPDKYAARAREAAAGIPDSELADKGRETEFHITAKYGLDDDEPTNVKKLLEGEGPISARIGKISVFPASETGGKYDVVKLDVASPDLVRLNKKIATLPTSGDTHPVYKPHITLAYVKPGEGKKYIGKSAPGLTGEKITFNSLDFSGKDEAKTTIPLKGEKKALLPESKAPKPAVSGPKITSLKSPELAAREDFPVGTKVELEFAGKTRQGVVFKEAEPGSPRVWVRTTNGTEMGYPVSRLKIIEEAPKESPAQPKPQEVGASEKPASYRVDVKARGENGWTANGQRFGSAEEADQGSQGATVELEWLRGLPRHPDLGRR